MAALVYRPVVYRDVRRTIRDGDVLLARPTRHVASQLIANAGGGPIPYSHALLAGWWEWDLFTLETLQYKDARGVCLSEQVKVWPGYHDVYRPLPPYDGHRALQSMRRIAGRPYGWRSLRYAFLRHVPFVRHWIGRNNPDWPPMCSQAVGRACRVGGRDPLPGADDSLIEPWHLGQPQFAEYQFTLFWSADQIPIEDRP